MVILVLTALVWLAMAMSEKREFPLLVRVAMEGYDSRQYAVVERDTTLTVRVEGTGFNMLMVSLRKEPVSLCLDIKDEAFLHRNLHGATSHSVAVVDKDESLKRELSSYGLRLLGSVKDSLGIVLAERQHRDYHPDISTIHFSFAEGYALYGEPKVIPSRVTLYGSESSLAKIASVKAKETELSNVSLTRTYNVKLDGDWKQYGDVYASEESLTVMVPVERYVEREYTLPVRVDGADSAELIRLFPAEVTLKVWVAQRDLPSLSADRFVVSVNYADIQAGNRALTPRLTRYPEMTRPKGLFPAEVKYAIIKESGDKEKKR